MNEININKNIYLPILKEFVDNTNTLLMPDYPWGPIIPFTLKNYSKAKRKYFYLDRYPTFRIDKNLLYNVEKIQNQSDYIEKMESKITFNSLLTPNRSGQNLFDIISRLQILLNTGSYYDDVPQNLLKYTKEIGYGTTTPLDDGICWSDNSCVNRTVSYEEFINYFSVINYAYKFVTIKNIIKAYNPDVIFVFSSATSSIMSSFDYRAVCEQLIVKVHNKYMKDKFFRVWEVKEIGTKIIWVPEVRYWRKFGRSIEVGIREIVDIVNNIS